MTVVLPTWTVVLPTVVLLAVGLFLLLRWVDRRFVTPRVTRWLARRWGVSIEEIEEAGQRLAGRGGEGHDCGDYCPQHDGPGHHW